MKKILTIITLGLISLIFATAQDNATNSTSSSLTFVTNTVTTIKVTPLKLTAEQMDGIIQLVQNAGIQAEGIISSTNLQNINVARSGANGFIVTINLRQVR